MISANDKTLCQYHHNLKAIMSAFYHLAPDDELNRALESNVHPPDWHNPRAHGRYNLLVIGAGTAGLVAAAGAAGLGAKVALIERGLLGGDCLNFGCVPSKAILRAARAAADVRDAHQFGIDVPNSTSVNFPAVMQRMRQLRANISRHDSAHRFRVLGVDVFLGDAHFVGADSVELRGDDCQTLRFSKALIATGARAAAPQSSGLEQAGYYTNETIFNLTELPRRMAVIGAGPIGCELAQAFARFGTEIHLIESEHGVLPNEDRDAAEIVKQSMLRDGIKLHCCSKQFTVSNSPNGKQIAVESHGEQLQIVVDEILVGVGRLPNVEQLSLEKANVRCDKFGIAVNDRLQTTNGRIYAAGDVCSRYKFTHAADAMARVVIQNALFWGRAKVSQLTIPWCTYTDPELAQVGLTERQAQEKNLPINTIIQSFAEVDRAILDGETNGLLKIHTKKGTDRIVGATMVGRHAGEMLSELTVAMVCRRGLKTLAKTIHPYPTQAEAIKKAADQFNRSRLTPLVKWLSQKWLAWSR